MNNRNIEYGQIGSCSKSKFKVYKQIIEEESDYEIVRENSEPYDKDRTLYYLDFKRRNYTPPKTGIRKFLHI